ncbi:STAS domain-containing protein [Streptomyces sp. NPDC020965]|uniref:STAS domain-containing protein n=1 Tax=Streptomyces sp. NPDC020965 TaxID=3365105 RepID=UPI0037B62CA9
MRSSAIVPATGSVAADVFGSGQASGGSFRGNWASRAWCSWTRLRRRRWPCGPGRRWLVVDCVSLSFYDSSGINGLVRLYQCLSAQGGRLRVAAAPASVDKVFSLTGLDTVIPLHISTGEALAAAQNERDRAADTSTVTRIRGRGAE